MNRTFLNSLMKVWMLVISVSGIAAGQMSQDVTLPPNSEDSGYVTIRNNCKQTAAFNVTAAPLAGWLRLVGTRPESSGTSFVVGSAGSADYTFSVNTSGLAPGTYTSTIKVTCVNCASTDPPCVQDGPGSFPINLTVTAPKSPGGGGDGSKPEDMPKPPTAPSTPTSTMDPAPTSPGSERNPETPPSTPRITDDRPQDGTTPQTPTAPPTPSTPKAATITTPTTPQTTPPPNVSEKIPTSKSDGIPLLPIVAGGLMVAGTVGVLMGSGKAPISTTDRPTSETPKTKSAGDWDATIKDLPPQTVGETPHTTTGDGVTPQKPPTGTTPVDPTSPTTPREPEVPGSWGSGVHMSTKDTVQTPTPNTPETHSKEPGSWGGSTQMGNHENNPNTTDKTNGNWGGSVKTGTRESHDAGGPKTQEAPKRQQPGNWAAVAAMRPPQPKPGDRNEGGGRTFSRDTNPADLANANRPVTEAELKAARPGNGRDAYAERELKTRERLANLRLAEESAPPISVDLDKPYEPTKINPPTLTKEDIDRLQFIDKKSADAEGAQNEELAKMWRDLAKRYRTFGRPGKGLTEHIDQLQHMESLLEEAKRNGAGPDLVDAMAAGIGQTTAKVPGLKQIFQAMGFSDRPLDSYGDIAKLERMLAEHEYLIYLYSTQGSHAVKKYLEDSAAMIYYGAVPGMVAGGALAGTQATEGAIMNGMPSVPTAKSKPARQVEEESFLPDALEKTPEDPEGNWDTHMPLGFEDDSEPILTDPKTGEAIPAVKDPKTGALQAKNPTPAQAPSGQAAKPASPETSNPADPNATLKFPSKVLKYDRVPAKGTQKTGYGDFDSIPTDPNGRPGTRLPDPYEGYGTDRPMTFPDDPTDPPVDPQSGQPFPEKTDIMTFKPTNRK